MTASLAAPSAPVRIESPHPPGENAPPRFPLVATIAPVIASLGLFAFTRSPFALAFAFLGPVVAIGSLVDGRVQRRRSGRRDIARFHLECEHAHAAIVRAHDVERQWLEHRYPPLSLIEALWLHTDESPQLRVGVGRATSSVVLATAPGLAVASPYRDRLDQLAVLARELEGAPVCIDPARGVTLRGDRAAALPSARAIVLRWAASLSPLRFQIERGGGGDWSWVEDLPHPVVTRRGDDEGVSFVRRSRPGVTGASGAPAVYALTLTSSDRSGTGSGSGAVVTFHAAGQVELANESGSVEFTPDLAAVSQAQTMAVELHRQWVGMSEHGGVPQAVAFSDLLQPGVAGASDPQRDIQPSLLAVIGRSRDGDVGVDLALSGPHAIVGGTTGSGKSELLLSWVLGMAAGRSPAEVTFLFVDYKGGASFGPLARLPHSVGVLTDLDDEQSARALESLSAELRFREQELARVGMRSIDEHPLPEHPRPHPLPLFPRLVVVVDEFAALIDGNAELHRLFVDLASRGRSLGVHLVLCTQRPAGVVRDGILANAGLRISLRVTNGSDSTAVIGTDDAALLPATARGRALVAEIGTTPIEIQVAQSTPADAERIIQRWIDAPAPRRPWCAPLAPRIPMPPEESLRAQRVVAPDDAVAVTFGMIDLPDEQRQGMVDWHPRGQGALVIVGAARSGKSTALVTLARASASPHVVLIDSGLPAMWDALDQACDRLDASTEASLGQTQTLLLLDDLDAVLGSAPDDYAAATVDRLTRVIREGAGHGISVAFTVQRLAGQLSSLAALCGSRLVLRLADRQEHLLAGGDGEHYSAALPPGAGWWGRRRVQVFDPSGEASLDRDHRDDRGHRAFESRDVALASVREWLKGAQGGMSIVSAHPDATIALLAQVCPPGMVADCVRVGDLGAAGQISSLIAAGRPYVVIGDPEAWQGDWGLLGSVRREPILFDGCSVADVRAITRSRELPPPFTPRERARWLRTPDGDLRRVKL